MTGEELRAARITIGLTQTQLGELLGYGRMHVQQMESGRKAIIKPVAIVIEALLDEWRPADFPDLD